MSKIRLKLTKKYTKAKAQLEYEHLKTMSAKACVCFNEII